MKDTNKSEIYYLLTKVIKGDIQEEELVQFDALCKSIPVYNFYIFAKSLTDLMNDKALHILIDKLINNIEIHEEFPLHNNERLKALISQEAKRYGYKIEFNEQTPTVLNLQTPKTIPDPVLSHFRTILQIAPDKLSNPLHNGSTYEYIISLMSSILNGLYLEYNDKFPKGFSHLILQIASRDAQIKYKKKLQESGSKRIMAKLGLDSNGKITTSRTKLNIALDDSLKYSNEEIDEKMSYIITTYIAKRIKLIQPEAKLNFIKSFYNYICSILNFIKSRTKKSTT